MESSSQPASLPPILLQRPDLKSKFLLLAHKYLGPSSLAEVTDPLVHYDIRDASGLSNAVFIVQAKQPEDGK